MSRSPEVQSAEASLLKTKYYEALSPKEVVVGSPTSAGFSPDHVDHQISTKQRQNIRTTKNSKLIFDYLRAINLT